MIRAAVIAGLMVGAGPALAEDVYDCKSVIGDSVLDLDFGVDDVDGTEVVTRVTMQIVDDMGYSSETTEPTARVTVTDATITGDTKRFTLHLNDGEYDVDVAEVYLATLWHGVYPMTGGVASMEGGGLWTMNCAVTYEEKGW
jgi:hypothetical protein